jgi:hypothetical protein
VREKEREEMNKKKNMGPRQDMGPRLRGRAYLRAKARERMREKEKEKRENGDGEELDKDAMIAMLKQRLRQVETAYQWDKLRMKMEKKVSRDQNSN